MPCSVPSSFLKFLKKTLNKEKEKAPLCPVFGQCGGCSHQDKEYAQELKLKENHLKETLSKKITVPENIYLPIVPSPDEYYYRHRIDLKLVRQKNGGFVIGFSPEGPGKIIPIEKCYIARKEIADFMPALAALVKDKLTPKYRQANIVIKTSNDKKIRWGGIGRHSLRLEEKDYLWAEVEGKKVFFSLDTFFQANLSILAELFKTIKQVPVWGPQTTLLDLYGGVGLFSIGLADHYSEAYLIEEVKASAVLARYNKNFHHMDNLTVIEGQVEKHLPDILEKKKTPVVAMIDPPRAGLSQKARDLLGKEVAIDHLLYLSCHPESLAEDLAYLTQSQWNIKRIVPLDFFPKTKHLETLVWLTKS